MPKLRFKGRQETEAVVRLRRDACKGEVRTTLREGHSHKKKEATIRHEESSDVGAQKLGPQTSPQKINFEKLAGCWSGKVVGSEERKSACQTTRKEPSHQKKNSKGQESRKQLNSKDRKRGPRRSQKKGEKGLGWRRSTAPPSLLT